MKQLLIVDGNTDLGQLVDNGNYLAPGAIDFQDLVTGQLYSQNMPSKVFEHNFAILLGRKNSMPIVISEVDINTLVISKVKPFAGQAAMWDADITILSPDDPDEDATITFVKGNTVPHERNTYTVVIDKKSIAKAYAAGDTIYDIVYDFVENKFDFVYIEGSDSHIGFKFKLGEQWTVKVSGCLVASNISEQQGIPPVGDGTYIKNLASQCAAGKGFNYVEGEGKEIYPGYPDTFVDYDPETDMDYDGEDAYSTVGYAIVTFRFAVPRNSAKTRDEVVNQVVHIAVPVGVLDRAADPTNIWAFFNALPEGNWMQNLISGGGSDPTGA